MNGGSSIYGPDGNILLAPVYDEQKIIYQELNLSRNTPEKNEPFSIWAL